MKLKIIKPDGMFYEGQCKFLEFPSVNGRMGVYKNHIPLTTILDSGEMRIHQGDEIRKASVDGGFIEIQKESVMILAEAIEWM